MHLCSEAVKGKDADCRKSARPALGGTGANGYKVEIVWHRREIRRQTEKTDINLIVLGRTGPLG